MKSYALHARNMLDDLFREFNFQDALTRTRLYVQALFKLLVNCLQVFAVTLPPDAWPHPKGEVNVLAVIDVPEPLPLAAFYEQRRLRQGANVTLAT